MVHVRLERLLEAEAHHALRRLHCQRGVGGDFSGKLSSCGHELIRLDDVAHEAGFERFLRGKGAPGESDLGRFPPADQSREEPGAAALR